MATGAKCGSCGAELDPDSEGPFCKDCAALISPTSSNRDIDAVEDRAIKADDSQAEGNNRRQIGRYILHEELGRGGMGVVYKAYHVHMAKFVGLKMIRNDGPLSPGRKARFQEEIVAVAKLRHPNIITVHDADEHEGELFFTMDYVKEGSLAEQKDKFCLPEPKPEDAPPMSESTTLDPHSHIAQFVAVIARAVHHVHESEILHRDLKPENILVDGRSHPYVTDFGLAKFLERDGETLPSMARGTPNYMAPEQVTSGPLTPATDVYGLGGILYFLLTGRPPFLGGPPEKIYRQVLEEQPEEPRKRNTSVHADLETICLKSLAKQPKRRYSSALALAEDLERWMAGQEIIGQPESLLHKALVWLQRNPAVAALATALVLVSTIAFIRFLGGPVKPPKENEEPGVSSPQTFELRLERQIAIAGINDDSWGNAKAINRNSKDKAPPQFILTQTGAWFVVSANGTILSQPTNELPRTNLSVHNPAIDDEDGHIFIAWHETNHLALATNALLISVDRSRNPNPDWSFIRPRKLDDGPRSNGYDSLEPCAIRKMINKNEELVTIFTQGYGLRPRGIAFFAPKTQNPIWWYETAGGPQSIVFMDADGDRNDDALFGSGAPANTNILSNKYDNAGQPLDDRHCYLYGVSRSKTNELWPPLKLGDRHRGCQPLLASSQSNELALFAWVNSIIFKTNTDGTTVIDFETGEVAKVDAKNGKELDRYDAGACLMSCVAHDLYGTGDDVIIATDRNGNIHVLNQELSLMTNVNLVKPLSINYTVDLKVAGITNLTTSGTNYIVLTSFQDHFVSGDPEGRPSPALPQVHHTYDVSVLVVDPKSLKIVATNVLANFVGEQISLRALLLDMDNNKIPEIVTLTSFESPRVLKFIEKKGFKAQAQTQP